MGLPALSAGFFFFPVLPIFDLIICSDVPLFFFLVDPVSVLVLLGLIARTPSLYFKVREGVHKERQGFFSFLFLFRWFLFLSFRSIEHVFSAQERALIWTRGSRRALVKLKLTETKLEVLFF